MKQSIAVLFFYLFSGFLCASIESAATVDSVELEEEPVRSKPATFSPYEPIILRMHLNPQDVGREGIRILSHQPTEEGQFDANNGWSIETANLPTVGDEIPTLVIQAVPGENAEPFFTVNFELAYINHGGISGWYYSHDPIPMSFTVNHTGHELEVVSSTGRMVIQQVDHQPARANSPAVLDVKLAQAAFAKAAYKERQKEKKAAQRAETFQSPRQAVEINLINDASTLQRGGPWYSLSCARLWPDYIDVHQGPLPFSARSWDTIHGYSLIESNYNAQFTDKLENGETIQHECSINPTTTFRVQQNLWHSLVDDGSIVLIIHRVTRVNFYDKQGKYQTRRIASNGQLYIRLSFKFGKLTVIGGNYGRYVSQIIIRNATATSPANMMIVMRGEDEYKLVSQNYADPVTSIRLESAEDQAQVTGPGIDEVDLGGAAMMLTTPMDISLGATAESMGTEMFENFATSPVGF